jgi:hypothetical protein
MNKFIKHLFDKFKKQIEPEQLNSPFVLITNTDGDKAKVQINGIRFIEDEEIEAKYRLDRWSTVTLIYRPESCEGDWQVRDYLYDTRPLGHMQCIRKKTKDNGRRTK